MNLDDYNYYRSRAFQEEEAGRSAACDAARQRHLQLADAYRDRCILILAGMYAAAPPADERLGSAGRFRAAGSAPLPRSDCELA